LRDGFTLLELIVVIILVSVLAGLALPEFIMTVERVRTIEAVEQLRVIRRAVDRCYLACGGGTYTTCLQDGPGFPPEHFYYLDIEDPTVVPGNHFYYNSSLTCDGGGVAGYAIRIKRNSLDLVVDDPGCQININDVCPGASMSVPSDSSEVHLQVNTAEGAKIIGHCNYEGMEW